MTKRSITDASETSETKKQDDGRNDGHKRKDGHKRSKRHRETKDEHSTLGAVLTWGLLQHPVLLIELPQILAAMDQGEVVTVNGISDPSKRAFLSHLFEAHLPVLQEARGAQGWYKEPQITSLSGYILMDLLTTGSIIQPSRLSVSQQHASRSLPLHLLNLNERYPEIRPDLLGLFESIHDGQGVVLDGLENEEIAEGLARVFGSLGLARGIDGWGLPGNRDDVREAVGCVVQMLLLGPERPGAGDKDGVTGWKRDEREQGDGGEDEVEDEGSQSSESGDDGNARDAADDAAMPPPNNSSQKMIGPSMPILGTGDISEDEEDDDVGPRPAVETSLGPIARYAVSDTPLGLDGLDDDSPVLAGFGVGLSSRSKKNSVSHEREEWMLTPGEQRAALEAFGENRKFSQGKLARKAAAAATLARGSIFNKAEPTAEELAAQALREEQRALRGPSLVDLHAASKAAGKALKNAKGFDYDRDIATHRNKVDSREARKLLDEARKLDSRFDRGAVPK